MQSRANTVPQIDLASLLAEKNPHIDLSVDAYDTSARNFLKALSSYKARTTATIAEKRTQYVAEKKRTIECVAKVEAEIEQCKIQELQLAADLQCEQEDRKNAELEVTVFKQQLAALRDKCAAIDSQIEHYRAIAANLERDKKEEKEKLSSMAAGTASQLAALESCLSCVVEGVADGQLLVRMSKIDPADPEREFSFVLNVSGDFCRATPSLAALPQLIAQLRDSQDIIAFIKDVRQAWVVMIKA